MYLYEVINRLLYIRVPITWIFELGISSAEKRQNTVIIALYRVTARPANKLIFTYSVYTEFLLADRTLIKYVLKSLYVIAILIINLLFLVVSVRIKGKMLVNQFCSIIVRKRGKLITGSKLIKLDGYLSAALYLCPLWIGKLGTVNARNVDICLKPF